MSAYKKKYLKSIGAGEQDCILCENPNCKRVAEHIHHIKAKGMGGRKDPDGLDNLIALCAECHATAHSNNGNLTEGFLKQVAKSRIDYLEMPKTCLF